MYVDKMHKFYILPSCLACVVFQGLQFTQKPTLFDHMCYPLMAFWIFGEVTVQMTGMNSPVMLMK
jgi:hypothetical protein